MNRVAIVLCVVAVGCHQTDPLYCGKHETDPTCGAGDASMGDAAVDAPLGFVTIGGSVFNNLAGTGLVLEDNGADDLMITTPGTFQFATPIESGTVYAVSRRARSRPTRASSAPSRTARAPRTATSSISTSAAPPINMSSAARSTDCSPARASSCTSTVATSRIFRAPARRRAFRSRRPRSTATAASS